MKNIKLRAGLLSCLCLGLALQAQSALVINFDDGAANRTPAVLTLNAADSSLTGDSNGNLWEPSTSGSFTSTDSSGEFSLTFMGLSDDTTAFAPGTWNGGSSFDIDLSTIGLGINDTVGNGNFQDGEAILLQIDYTTLSLGAGDYIQVTAAGFGGNGFQVWERDIGVSIGTSDAGVLIGSQSASDAPISLNESAVDGGLYAFVTDGGAGGPRLTSLTIDVIPEPATMGLVAVFGSGLLIIRRRLML